jgi:hypothetical protein
VDGHFQGAAEVLYAIGFAKCFHRNGRVQLLVGTNCMEVDVEDVTTQWVVLDLLNQGQAIGTLATIRNLEVDQDVLTGRWASRRLSSFSSSCRFWFGRSFP